MLNLTLKFDFFLYFYNPKIPHMKYLASLAMFFLHLQIHAQVGVGTTSPNNSSVLDIYSSNLGFLLPRVALNSISDTTTITTPIKGLIVYNNGLGGLSQSGMYRWTGIQWSLLTYKGFNCFSGDITGNTNANTVVGIRSRPIVFSSPTANQLLRFNGTSWINSNDVSSQNWLMKGNVHTSGANFLGTIDDVKMTLKSYNQPFFEFGRRQTLGLTQGYADYTDNNQSVTHLLSAIQFETIGSVLYKPMFFVNSSGNFRFKGSMAGDDYFEIGAAGSTANDGSVEFIVGDEGDEPIVFGKYNNATNIELIRMQGTGANSQVRVGINNNTTVANSVLQINGSISRSIVSTSTSLTLTDAHYTVVFTGGNSSVTITLPAASSVAGRIYVIRNTSGSTKAISNFITDSGSSINVLNDNSVVWLQSDGTNWISI
jgi:hypothetical protein